MVVDVPEGDALRLRIRHALRDHVEKALNRAFPPRRDDPARRQGRTRALLALRQLADSAGRRAGFREPQGECLVAGDVFFECSRCEQGLDHAPVYPDVHQKKSDS
jgi:hypothetical protein